jgi:hypothetical protein
MATKAQRRFIFVFWCLGGENVLPQKRAKIIGEILNPDNPEITNYNHQIANKLQITISRSQIRLKTNCLEF